MGDDMKILSGGFQKPVEPSRIGRTGTAQHTSVTAAASDQVSLSRLYSAIKSSETALRLQTLSLQVNQRTYWIPAHQISGSLLTENMIIV